MKTRQSEYSFTLAHSEVRTKLYVYFHKSAYINKQRSVKMEDCISVV